MKSLRKIMALLIAMVMVLGMSVSVFAANHKVSTSSTTHTYEIYQIFTGTVKDNQLTQLKYGKNAVGTVGAAVSQSDMKGLDAISKKTYTDDQAKIADLKKYVNLSSTPVAKVGKGEELQAFLPEGYYLIKDVDKSLVNTTETYTLYIINILSSDLDITAKSSKTTSDKKVDDKNDSNSTEDGTDWQDSADYDIGDSVPFKLSATIADDYANYTKTYKLTFHDKEEKGLTFDASSVVVKVDDVEITSGYEVVTEALEDGDTFEVRFANLKDIDAVHAKSIITVEYTSTLNEDAEIGTTGNKNTSHVTYSNNPNDEQGGENGKTEDDTVIVFTYKLDVDKIDADGNALTGAGFTLYKKNASGEYKPVGTELKGEELTNFAWKGIDDGDYKIVETTVPTGYNKADDIEFTVTAEHDLDSADPKLTKLTVTEGKGLTTILDGGEVTITKNNGKKNIKSGEVFGEVINQSGSTLPSTGGMGTTLFYIVGGILVAGAAIILIAKRKVNA